MHKMIDSGDRHGFNRWIELGERFSKANRYQLTFRSRPFGLASPFDTYMAVQDYNLRDVADQIQCPMLITDPEDEHFWPGQSRELFEMLKCPKELVPFSQDEGGSLHCEPGAAGLRDQRIFDWLDKTLL